MPKPKPAEGEEGKEAQPEPAVEEENKEELPKIFEEAKTYMIIEFELSEPFMPTEENFVLQALPHDLILPKAVTQAKIKPMKDPEGDFRKQLKLAIESINKEYLTMFEEDLKREGIGGCSDETFEARKEQFLYEFNTSGKYHIMKEKLKKTIVRIVRDTFKKKKKFKGLHMDEQDHFYSILYAHLVHQVQICIKNMVETTKDSLHENILISDKKAAEKEIENLLDSHTKETEEERLTRLSSEYEELGFLDKAHSYIEELAKVSPDSIDLWRNYALFMLRNYGHFEKAEECLREAISLCEENDDELFLVYGAMLVQMKEKKRALIFLTKVGEGEHNPEFYIKAHLLMSILYQRIGEQDLMEKHLAYASRMKLRQEGKLLDKESLKNHLPDAQTSEAPRVFPKLEEKEKDELYFDLIESLLLPEGFTNLASETLEHIKDQESPKVVKTKAKIMFGERKYNEVLETIEEYLDEHKFDVDAIKLFADAYFHLERYEESEKAFLRAIRRG